MKRFKNAMALEVINPSALKLLDLPAFPVVEDFVVVPMLGSVPSWRMPLPHLIGAEFYSRELGLLISCRWWEGIFYINRIRGYFSAQDAPNGTIDEPHFDFQPAWQIFIFEQEEYVYVLQADNSQEDDFSTWFRVSSQNYSMAWLKAVAEAELHSG